MSAKTPAATAGKVIAAKADRILSRLDPSARGAPEQRRHASALLHLATEVSADSSYAARAIDDARSINEKDRELAGEMVSRRAGTAYGKDQLQDAIALYGIALSIHDDSDWQSLRGFAQVQALDFAGAKASFEAVRGYHAAGAAYRAKLCGLQLKGVDLLTMPAPDNPEQAQILKNFLFHMKGAQNSPEAKARRERAEREQRERMQAEATQPATPRIPLNRGEVNGKFVDKVTQAIAAKADRTLAGIKSSDRKADEKRRQVSALLMLASELSDDGSFAARAPDKAAAINDEDRVRAATEANSLATRAEGAGKLRDAIAYYDIALSLHYEGYWVYLKALLLQRLEDYAAAAQTFESVQGTYAQYAAPLAEQCRQQQAGTPAAEAGLNQLMSWMKNVGGDKAVDALRMFGDAINAAASLEPDGVDDARDNTGSESELTPQEQADLELASNTAQVFAEHLVRGDFAAADAMLTKAAQPPGGAEELRTSYLVMIQREDDGAAPEDAEVMVMSNHQVNEQDRETGDLGWVYVAISGEDFNEAVTVIVTRVNGQPHIRSVEWGRP